jgi:uncharacterized tellurite resistance protein B-like protein
VRRSVLAGKILRSPPPRSNRRYPAVMNLKVAKCLLVSKVLVADGIMTENERIFLDKMMRRLGLDDEERRRVIDLEGWDEAEPVVAKLSLDEKREFVSMLIDASSADGRLSPLEMETVTRITSALGVD